MTDFETCSWCCDEVPYSTLREQADGAMVCKACRTSQAQRESRSFAEAR